jgi:hypothetical protein
MFLYFEKKSLHVYGKKLKLQSKLEHGGHDRHKGSWDKINR